MKKFLLFIGIALFLSSCAIYNSLDPGKQYFNEIVEIGGDMHMEITAEAYEVRIGEEITRSQQSTQTFLYLYELNNNFYWKIKRDKDETESTFFPQSLDIKITIVKKGENSEDFYGYTGIDELTGKRYLIASIPWKDKRGMFYFVGDGDKQIVYSVPIYKVITFDN